MSERDLGRPGPAHLSNPVPGPNWTADPPAPPKWAPPEVPRRQTARWVPPVVVAVVGCLVLAALFLGDRVGRPTETGVARFLAADGDAWYGERRTSADGETATAGTVTESAVVIGTAIAGAVDFQLGGAILGETGDGLAVRNRFWRTTTATVASPIVREAKVYRVGADLVLVGESRPSMSFRYAPGLVELPSGVTPGTSWEGAGSAGAGISYRSSFRADAVEQDCLRVSGTISYVGEELRLERDVAKTWCPGRGITATTERTGASETSWSRSARPEIPSVTTTDSPSTWNPARWQPQELLSTSIDPVTGTSPMPGSPGAVPPVFTASNVLIRVATSGQDLIAFTPDSGSNWALRWRSHPGGTVLTASAFGDVLVATTSDRRVAAYTDDGVRLWSLDLDEVVLKTPVRASPGELALVTLGGDVLMVELTSGQIRWQRQPGVDVGVAPVVSAGVSSIADRSGALIGMDASTGVDVWRTDLPPAQFQAAIGGVLAVVAAGDIYGVDLHTGERLWRRSYVGAERALVSVGDWVVLTRVGGSTAFDAAGREVWNEPGVHAVTPHGPHLVRWGRVTADVVDRTGAVVTRYDTPADTAGNTQRFAAGRNGVYLLDGTWKFRGWARG